MGCRELNLNHTNQSSSVFRKGKCVTLFSRLSPSYNIILQRALLHFFFAAIRNSICKIYANSNFLVKQKIWLHSKTNFVQYVEPRNEFENRNSKTKLS